jgi:outer membrane protein TolC
LPNVPAPPFLANHKTFNKLRAIDGIVLEDESSAVTVVPASLEKHDAPLVEQLPAPQIAPPESMELSLADARASALDANLDIAVELINPAIARTVVSQETARFEATFDSSFTTNRADPPPGLAAGGTPDTTLNQSLNSITQPLTTGGEVRILHNINAADTRTPGDPNTVNSDVGLEFRQPLLRGAGFQVSTAGIRIAQVQTGIVDAQSKLTAIRVLAEIERAYWQLYATIRIREIAQQQLELAEKQYAAAKRLVEAEVLIKVDQSRAETGVLARRNAAISAETDVRLAERELKRIMQLANVPVDSDTRLTLATKPELLELVFDRPNLAARALDNRMEMLQLQLQVLARSIDIDRQRNSVLPQLDLIAHIDALGLEESYQRSLEVLTQGEFSDNLIGLALEVPLSGNVAARARLRSAQLLRMQTFVVRKRMTVLITQEVYNAIDQLEQNWLRIVATRQASQAARETFEGESKLYQSGRQASNFVLIALTNLGDAEIQEVLAITDYQLAKVDLALATGTMLGYGQVYWNPCKGAMSPLPDPPNVRIFHPEYDGPEEITSGGSVEEVNIESP